MPARIAASAAAMLPYLKAILPLQLNAAPPLIYLKAAPRQNSAPPPAETSL